MTEHSDQRENRNENYILAAGGLLGREAGDGVPIALVYRVRYQDHNGSGGDVVLPKGKKRPEESLEDTALREVREETGCTVHVVGPAFSTEHVARGTPKVTTYFRMVCTDVGEFADVCEGETVIWLTPDQAVERLTYDDERAIVEQAYRPRSDQGR